MIARHQARLVATLAIALSVVTATAFAQGVRAGNPAAPKLLVGTLKSTDQKLGPDAAEAIRDRVGGDVSPRNLTVIPKADILAVLGSSGYPTTEALSDADMFALAKQTRADEFIQGAVTKTATGFQISVSMVLARDMNLVQPLGTFDHGKLEGAAAQVSKAFQDAHKAFEPEKRCRLLAREGKPADAQKEAASGLQQFPKSVWLRMCQLEIARDTKRPPAEIIKVAEEILAIDPNSKPALTELVKQYDAAGNNAPTDSLRSRFKEKKIETLLKLYNADPMNPRLLSDVVNELALNGKCEVALPIVEKYLSDNPGDVQLVRTYWLILGCLDHRKKMNAVGEEMVKIDTSFADSAFFDRTIRAYATDSNYQKAAEAAAHATAKFPKIVSFWVFRQQLERRAGQTQRSIASIRRIMELDPKALPAPHGAIAQAYLDMNQPDSALAEIRLGMTAGEEKKVMSTIALKIGNDARLVAEQKKEDIGEWKKSYALLAFVDSIAAPEVRAQAKFLFGLSAFQIGYLTLKDNATNAKSCDVAKEAQKYLLAAQTNLPAGGSFAPGPTGQYLGLLGELLPNSDQQVKVFCKPRDATKKP